MSNEQPTGCEIHMTDKSTLELRDETGLLVALACKAGDLSVDTQQTTGRDTWAITRQGGKGVPEFVDGELPTRARLHEIGEQWC